MDANFILDLACFSKTVNECSVVLHPNFGLDLANKKLKMTTAVVDSKKTLASTYRKHAAKSVQNLKFSNISLHTKKINDPIKPVKFYESLKT